MLFDALLTAVSIAGYILMACYIRSLIKDENDTPRQKVINTFAIILWPTMLFIMFCFCIKDKLNK